jgi:signal transduction histidine kinase
VDSLLPTAAGSTDHTASAAALEATREIAGRLLLTSLREQEAREAAEDANRAKDRFLATLSHELRTPLNAILGWCAILAGRSDPPEHGLDVIENNARAQLKLIDDLLDTAQITSSSLTIRPEPISLQRVLLDVADTVLPAAAAKQVELRTAVPRGLPRVIADPDRIRQVLLNVLGNALKFTDAGGAIDMCAGADSDHVQVTVRDTGRGIAPDVLPYVFEQFRRGDAGEPALPGLGLGLTIARAVVERHGGTIEIDSPGENQGTICIVRLPRAGVAAHAERATPA